MDKLYDRRFKFGAGLFAVGLVVANVVSYMAALQREQARDIRFAPYSFPPWGFPFSWDGGFGSIANWALLLFGALLFGLLFKWITSLGK